MASTFDVGSYLNTVGTSAAYSKVNSAEYTTDLLVKAAKEKKTADKYSMDMEDFLKLMVAQLTNQGIDDSSDPSEMLNQMVQMQMVTAITAMSETMTTLTDSNVMSYAGSLVGKEVTIGVYDDKGNLEEKVVTITGTGQSDGEQVLFVGNDTYKLNSVMAVGRLPEIKTENVENKTEGTTVDKTETTDKTEAADKTENTTKNEAGGSTGDTAYDGSSGAPKDTAQ